MDNQISGNDKEKRQENESEKQIKKLCYDLAQIIFDNWIEKKNQNGKT